MTIRSLLVAETRRWVLRGLKSVAPRPPRAGKKRQQIEPW